MAKSAKEKEAERLAKLDTIYQARIDILRYMAFTGIEDYFRVTDFSALNGYRKMDSTECTKYYIDKGWMTGEPLKNSGSYINSAHLNDFKRCAVIANSTCADIDKMYSIAVDVLKPRYGSYGPNNGLNKGYCRLTKALNIFCRAFPEKLNAFKDMDDFPVSISDEKEIKLAFEDWELAKVQLLEPLPEACDISFLSALVYREEFKDFFLALPFGVTGTLLMSECAEAEKLHLLDDEEYQYLISLAEPRGGNESQRYLQGIHDSLVFYHHFLRYGDVKAHKDMMNVETHSYCLLSAYELLQDGNANEAFKLLEKDLKSHDNIFYANTFSNYIYGLSILLADIPAALKKAETILKKRVVKDNQVIPYFKLLLQKKAHPETEFGEWMHYNISCTNATPLGAALTSLICIHYGLNNKYKDTFNKYAEKLSKQSIKILAVDFLRDSPKYQSEYKKLLKDDGLKPLLPEFKILEPWEIVLNTMLEKYDVPEKSGIGKRVKTPKMEIGRVLYYLNTHNYDVQPRLQKSKDGGVTWSGGRNIALKTFQAGIPEMTAQDRSVANYVETWDYGWYGGTGTSLGGENVIEALVGHPLVFDAYNPDVKIEIQTEKLQILVIHVPEGYKVTTNVSKSGSAYKSLSVKVESAQLIKVVSLSKEEIEILTLFDRIGIFPNQAKEQLTRLLAALGKKVTVMSSLLKNAENVKKMKGDSRLTVQLVPYGEEFTARCFVKPLTTKPPYCTPGAGLEFIATNIKGKTAQVVRNLKAENKNLKSFREWMEPFAEYETDGEWQMPMLSCLEVLDTLRQHTDTCIIEWPEGVRFSVRRPMLDSNSIRLSVKGIGHWFEIDGEVNINDEQQMKISELLTRVRQSKGRFIQIGDDEYVALSKQLHKQLAALERIVQTDKKTIKISSYNSSFLKDISDAGVNIKTDKKYAEMLKRMDEADTMKFCVPKTLQADLRDYQLDGYRWLCRLKHWGVGACLADDMGLGKTIQTIALLLAHAKEGASLVVMPTSVLINWRNELQRFAPSLNPIVLREATDRAAAVSAAGAQDVVLVTYGLLPTEEETLQSKQWNIIVLDEAHTIKNKDTKTSKVAMTMQSSFRLLLTGTPLQNHLSEIWNLFQFATPGLLPGYIQFTQEFITPIERDNDKDAQRLLKRMLQPFILRRTKNDVLDELPEKTEITLKVELSDAERALYDRFRQEAVLNLEEGAASAIKALAELTKLRQTACNAALVLPEKEAKAIPSSKMETFLKLVEELQSNHHRALVFSQFTSHLALVRKELEHLGIEYEYIDGSISANERISRVAEFQKGDMPLFLISLKAGGTGLNITAADYVIHLDPWWNPSIEDQASDRAYRIGQDKPVTVYRIIAENTIEEKIIALHKTKKSLADALLEGSDMSHTLGKEEILNLIRGAE